jgi:hypothetical protein
MSGSSSDEGSDETEAADKKFINVECGLVVKLTFVCSLREFAEGN